MQLHAWRREFGHISWPATRLLVAVLLAWFAMTLSTDRAAAADESSSAAIGLFSDAAGFQNNQAYGLAIEEWQNFLRKHPGDPLATKARHYLGVCLLQQKKPDLAGAIGAFEQVIGADGDFELIEETYLNLGACQYSLAEQQQAAAQTKRYQQAAKTFGALVTKYPKSKHAPQAFYFLGESLYRTDKFAAAVAAYESLLKQHPDSSFGRDASYALGTTYEELGQFKKACETYDQFMKRWAADELADEVRLRRAESLLQLGDLAAAAKEFGELVKTGRGVSGNGDLTDYALSRQALATFRQQQFASAGKLYANLAEQFPQSPYASAAAINAARAFYRAKDNEQAEPWLKRVIGAPNHDAAAEAAHWLCRIYLDGKQSAAAAKLATAALAKNSTSPFLVDLQLDLADARYEDPAQRQQAYQSYVAFARDHADHSQAAQALYNAAFAALELKHLAPAVEHGRQFLAKYPQHTLTAEVQEVVAEGSIQSQQYAEAEKMLGQMLATYPNHAQRSYWTVRLGLALSLQKKDQAALALLSKAADSLGDKQLVAEAFYLQGIAHHRLGDLAKAAGVFSTAVKADPRWTQADETLLRLASVEIELKKYPQAQASLQALLKEFPQSKLLDRAHYRLAQSFYQMGQFADATRNYDLILSQWPETPLLAQAIHGKGWSELKLGQYAAAAKSFSRFLTDYSDHTLASSVRRARATCRQQTGDFAGGSEDIGIYLKGKLDRADRSDAFYLRGLCEIGLEDHAAAIATLTSILSEDKGFAAADKVLYELGWAYQASGDADKSVASFRQLLAEHAKSPLAAEGHFHVGESHYAAEQFKQAEQHFEQARKASAAGELKQKATYKLAWARFRDNRFSPALAAFDDLIASGAKGPLSSDAVLMRAECLFHLKEYAEAMNGYRLALKTKVDRPEAVALATLHAGQAAGHVKNWDESIRLLAGLLKQSPDTSLADEATYELGWAYQQKNRPDDALRLYEKVTAENRAALGAQARFMMGEVEFGRKKFDVASRHFQRVAFGYGAENAPSDVKPWQAKAAYEAARCSEVQINEAPDGQKRRELVDEAQKFYRQVVTNHADSPLAEQARTRFAALAKLK